MSNLPGTIRVKRDGPRGWHTIARANYNPEIHELADVPDRDPLDHDGDGHKGGSLPASDPNSDRPEPVAVEEPVAPAEAPKPASKPRAKRQPARRKTAK